MFYYIVRFYVRIALVFFCRSIKVTDKKVFDLSGPLLLACNHPNSFFDAILLGARFNRPVHFLARGDAFKKPIVKKILSALKAIPIYRLKEGREYLSLNDATFEQCEKILIEGGIILIFSEGLCINQWKLRKLKKGTGRIAIGTWNDSPSAMLQVLPVCLNYNSFNCFGKRIIISFQELFHSSELAGESEGEILNHFNHQLFIKLEKGLLISENQDAIVQFLLSNVRNKKEGKLIIHDLKNCQQRLVVNCFEEDLSKLDSPKLMIFDRKDLLLQIGLLVVSILPGLIGILLNYPLYLLLKKVIKDKTEGTVFYDSVMFASILITYPIYYLLVNAIGHLFIGGIEFYAVILCMPMFALASFVAVECIHRIINYFKISKERRIQLKTLFDLV